MEVLKECSFRPKINKVSKSIDDNNKKRKIKIGELVDSEGFGMGIGGLATFAHKEI
jgi:hypothetical protein